MEALPGRDNISRGQSDGAFLFKDSFDLQKGFYPVFYRGHSANILGAGGGAEVGARFNFGLGEGKYFIDGINHDPKEGGAGRGGLELEDDDAGTLAIFSRRHGKFGPKIEDGNNRATEIDHPSQMGWHVGGGGDGAESDNLSHLQNR